MSVKIYGEGDGADLRLRLVGGQWGVLLAAVDEDGDVLSYLLGIGEKDGGHSLTLYSFVGSEHGFLQDEAGTIIPQRESDGVWEPEEDDLYDDGESEDADDDEEDSRESDAPRRVMPWVPGITTKPNDVLLDIESDGTLQVVDGKGKHIPGGYLARFYREGVLRFHRVGYHFGFKLDEHGALEAGALTRSERSYADWEKAIPRKRLGLFRYYNFTVLSGVDSNGLKVDGETIAIFYDNGRVRWASSVSPGLGIATDDKEGRVIDIAR